MEVISRQPSLLTSKHGFHTGDAFDAKTEAFGIVSGEKRTQEILRQRLESELVNVRGLLRKAKAAAVRPLPAPRVKHSRPLPFLAEEPPSKKTKASPPVSTKDRCVKDSRPRFLSEEPPAKKRKASPVVPVPALIKKRKKMTSSEREMLAEDLELFVAEIPDHILKLLEKQSCASRRDEIEIDIHALQDATLVELQQQVDNFAREKKRRANPSPPQEQHQDQDGMAEEEEVDIIGGVSPLKIAPEPLLQLVEEDEGEEDVDICGGVSPMPILLPAPVIPFSSSSPSGSQSSSSCSDSGCDSDSDDDSVDKFAIERKRSPQEEHQDQDGMAEEEEEEEVDIIGGVSPLTIAPAPLLQLVEEEEEKVDIMGGVSPLTMVPAPLLQLVEEEEEEIDICGGVSPLPIQPAPAIPCSSSPTGSECSSSNGSDSDSDSGSECTSSSDSDSDDEIVDGPAAPAERPATPPIRELVAGANQSPEAQWKEAVSQAREKARQEVLETERTAMPDETLHHLKDIKALKIDEYNMTKPNNVLRQIGLFLKVEDEEGLKYLNFEEHFEEGEIWL